MGATRQVPGTTERRAERPILTTDAPQDLLTQVLAANLLLIVAAVVVRP